MRFVRAVLWLPAVALLGALVLLLGTGVGLLGVLGMAYLIGPLI